MNPFETASSKPLVAICGQRKGYLQLSFTAETTQFSQADPLIYAAAHAWCETLENFGARRVYWIVLSEQVRQLHIHLYPRWSDEEDRGLLLFEQRDQPQPILWEPKTLNQLAQWAHQYYVELLPQPPC